MYFYIKLDKIVFWDIFLRFFTKIVFSEAVFYVQFDKHRIFGLNFNRFRYFFECIKIKDR